MAQVTKRSKEEMAKLWEEFARTRELKIKNILSEEYLPIVRYVAEKMIERLPHNVQVEDLVSAGVFGLFDAVDRFDLSRGVGVGRAGRQPRSGAPLEALPDRGLESDPAVGRADRTLRRSPGH